MDGADARDLLRRLPVHVAIGLIAVYRYGVSPVIGPRCRFWPSCSAYGQQALQRHGLWRGLALAAARIGRCHPWNPGGVDPVPERFEDDDRSRYLGRVLRGPAHDPIGSPAGSTAGIPSDAPRSDFPNPTSRP